MIEKQWDTTRNTGIVYNREVADRIIVWPGYWTDDAPKELIAIEKEMGAGFTANSREKNR